jgi:hypothetical protein
MFTVFDVKLYICDVHGINMDENMKRADVKRVDEKNPNPYSRVSCKVCKMQCIDRRGVCLECKFRRCWF